MLRLVVLLFLLSTSLQGGGSLVEEEVLSRVSHHLVLEDYSSGLKELEEALLFFPNSKSLLKMKIEVLASGKEERSMLKTFKEYLDLYSYEDDTDLLEIVSWGVLLHAGESPLLPIQTAAIIGGVLTQDIKSVDLVYRGLFHTSAYIRQVSIQLTPFLRDQRLIDALVLRYQEEIFWPLRLEIIDVLGKMRVNKVRGVFKEKLFKSSAEFIESKEIVEALSEIDDKVSLEEIEWVSQHPRYSIRLLAPELVYVHDFFAGLPFIFSLIEDSNPSVCVAALTTLILMREEIEENLPLKEKLLELIASGIPSVKVTSAWGLLLLGDERGEVFLRKFLEDDDSELRGLAAGAIAASGSRGLPLAEEKEDHKDFFVRATLAWACLQQRYSVERSIETLLEFLKQTTTAISWIAKGNPIFLRLGESEESYHPLISNYSNVMDQLTRLKILSLLLVVDSSKAQDGMRKLLKEREWTITQMASILLLEEGDLIAAEGVNELLEDEDLTLRLNSALLLALWGRDQEVLPVLEEIYPVASRHQKIQILDAVGRLGALNSKEFLINTLTEPSQMLRLVSASSLLRCIKNGY